MDGSCILQWGVCETEFRVCKLLHTNTEKNTLFHYSPSGAHCRNNLLFELFVIFIQLEIPLHMKLFAIFLLIFTIYSLKLRGLKQTLLRDSNSFFK